VIDAPDAESRLGLTRQLPRDLVSVFGVALIALAAGLATSRLRSSPLPLTYQTPEERLAAELKQLVNAPPFRLADFNTVGFDQFRKLVSGRQVLVLDAHAKPFYVAGYIPGALNLSRVAFPEDYQRLRPTLERAKEDRPVVVYCSGGDCHDSRLVASALLSLGYTNVQIFTGGWAEWSARHEDVGQ
jgi:rhodanese-related sulfurtransferase